MFQDRGKKAGMYFSIRIWKLFFGDTEYCSNFSDLPLWYAHYDKVENFSDWLPYGGWNKPYAKQF